MELNLSEKRKLSYRIVFNSLLFPQQNWTDPHTHRNTHSHTHTVIHIHTHTHTHTNTHSHTHTVIHIHTHTHTHTFELGELQTQSAICVKNMEISYGRRHQCREVNSHWFDISQMRFRGTVKSAHSLQAAVSSRKNGRITTLGVWSAHAVRSGIDLEQPFSCFGLCSSRV